MRSRKSESKSRRALRRQPESLDSVDSAVASLSSSSSTPHYRFRSSSSGPLFSSPSSSEHGPHLFPEQEELEMATLTTRCSSSSEKSRPRSRGNRSCPPKPREPGEGGGRRRDTDFSPVQPLVLYGSKEFMVWGGKRVQLFSELYCPQNTAETCLKNRGRSLVDRRCYLEMYGGIRKKRVCCKWTFQS